MAQPLEKIPVYHDEEEESDDGDEEQPGQQKFEGQYNPSDYLDLAKEDPELQQVFSYITAYTPQTVELEFKLKPFIPEFIPSVGDIDAFIKVPRPDGVDDGLGLMMLDEPSSRNQSDASLLALRLRALTKELPLSNEPALKVRTAAGPKEIDSWIESIKKLHQETNGAPIQTQRLPDIDHLMQEWDPEFEEVLNTVQLPSPDLDCELSEYVSIVCSLLDIPVHGSKVTSLHQLFSLYNEFQSSQHFRRLDAVESESD